MTILGGALLMKGVSSHTHTKGQVNNYANQHNPNNSAYQANRNNHANQLNPNHQKTQNTKSGK